MALPDTFVNQVGTQIIFADHAADFVGGAAGTSLEVAGTDVQIDLTSTGAGGGEESSKVDLGASRASAYSVMAALEFATAPVTGEVVEFYWAPSPQATAGNGNPQGMTGVATVAPTGHSTLAELVLACDFIGNFVCSADATTTVQVAKVGVLVPTERYGMLIVVNSTSDAFMTDAVESHVVFNPITNVVID